MPTFSLIDSHCHLDFINFDKDRDAVLERAKKNGINNIIIPAVSVNNWQKIQALCNQHPNLHPCYGLHPYWVEQHKEADIKKLEAFINETSCIAIGECGLDYRPEQANKEKQQYFFEAQLNIAQQNNLPIVIHAVNATEEVIKQLRKRPDLRGMIHSYSGSYEQALQLIKMGFYISISGAISYKHAKKLQQLSSKLPLTSLLIETDAPDQPDSTHHRQRNEPAYLTETLDALTKLRSEEKEKIALQTTVNAKTLFRID